MGLTFGPGGRLYSAAMDRQVIAWNLDAAATPLRLSGPELPTADHAETFGGSWVVGNYPQQDGTNATAQRLFALDARTGRQRSWPLGLAPGSWVNQTVADADGSVALVSVQDADSHCSFQLWNLRTGTRITEIPGPVDPAGADAALSPDGRRAVISVDKVHLEVIAVPSGRRLARFSVRFADPGASRLYPVPWYFTPDGSVLVAAYDPGPPQPGPPGGSAEVTRSTQAPENQRFGLLDLRSHRLTAQVGLGADPMTAVAWSPDGRRLAVGTTQGELRLYDARTLQVLQDAGAAHAGYVRSVSFSPDGSTLASAGTDGALRLWGGHTLALEGGRIASDADAGSTWWYAFYLPSGDLAGLAPGPSGADGSGGERYFTFPGRPQEWLTSACRFAGDEMSRAEWRRLLGNRPYERSCS
jgi:WD40 repeat protein